MSSQKDVDLSKEWLKDGWEDVRGPFGPTGMKKNVRTGEMLNHQQYTDAVRHHSDIVANPIRPEYDTLMGEDGLLKTPYKFDGKTLDPNNLEGFQAIKKDAMRQGPSAWANLMMESQKLDQHRASDDAATQGNSALAQARSSMAMRGGLGSGARERLGGSALREIMNARQQIAGRGEQQRLGIQTTDETNRQGLLKEFMGAEGKLAAYNNDIGNKSQEFNIQRAIEEKRAKDAFAMDTYKEQMAKWAADRQARATENSGGGGNNSWVCTKIHQAVGLSPQVKSALVKLRRFSLMSNYELAHFYLYQCSELAERMDKAGVNWAEMTWFTDKITELVQADKMDEAMSYYTDAMIVFTKAYWPDTSEGVLVDLLGGSRAEGKNVEMVEVV
jgi:hypothetical protein